MNMRNLATAFALVVGFGAAGLTTAADFSVYPVRVELGTGQQTAILSLHNDGAQPLRLQVRAFVWGMDAAGKWQLDPSDDLIVNPQLFEIGPKQSAQLRVGTLLAPMPRERAWRLLVDELPGLDADTGNGSVRVRMLTRLSLPVFLEPAGKAAPHATLADVQLRRDQLLLSVRNDGNVRFDPQPLKVSVRDAAGRELFNVSPTLAYLLPGAQLDLKLTVPARVCAAAATIWIGAGSANTGTIAAENAVRVEPSSCAASSPPAR